MLSRDDIIQKLQIQNSDVVTQDELLQQLANSVRARITLKLSEQMSDEDLDKLSGFIDAGQDEQAEDYIKSKIPDYDAWAAKIEEDTINEIGNNSAAISAEVEAMKAENISVD